MPTPSDGPGQQKYGSYTHWVVSAGASVHRQAAAVRACTRLTLRESITCAPPAHPPTSSLILGLARGISSDGTDLVKRWQVWRAEDSVGRGRRSPKFRAASWSPCVFRPEFGGGESQGHHERGQGQRRGRTGLCHVTLCLGSALTASPHPPLPQHWNIWVL